MQQYDDAELLVVEMVRDVPLLHPEPATMQQRSAMENCIGTENGAASCMYTTFVPAPFPNDTERSIYEYGGH